jgi:AhpD family alkylhydroperoxidase
MGPIEYSQAPPEVRAVYDDIKATRRVADVNNFWKYLANDPATLRRTWTSVKEVMARGALDELTKEMIYLAVSASNGCEYCIASHTAAARAKGMTTAMLGEVLAVVGMANETNRLVQGWRVPVDAALAVGAAPSVPPAPERQDERAPAPAAARGDPPRVPRGRQPRTAGEPPRKDRRRRDGGGR